MFRVTSTHIGIDEGELRAYHGITLDAVNRELLRAINAINATHHECMCLYERLLTFLVVCRCC